MVSEENLVDLARGAAKYLVCMPHRCGSEAAEHVISRPGRYRRIADQLHVEAVTIGDGERRRRYVVCYNPEEEKRQRKQRADLAAHLAAELLALQHVDSSSYTKRVSELVASRRNGRDLRRTSTGKLRLDQAAVQRAEKRDRKLVVHSNDDTLGADDMAVGYEQLMRVEQAWRQLKSGRQLRPVFHWAPHRIHAHVFLTVLALLPERVAEEVRGDTWRNIHDDLRQIELARFPRPNGQVWQVTEPRQESLNYLNLLGISRHLPVLDPT